MRPAIFTIIVALVCSSICVKAQEMVTIHGQVTDFNTNPIDSVTIRLKNQSFANLYSTVTDRKGHYTLKVPKGNYYCLYAINLDHYGKTKLEYWTWNVPALNDLEINPQYERMEIYGMNVFEPQVSPCETYMIYFRPMSLTKALRLSDESSKQKLEKEATSKHDTIDIAPLNISPSELTIRINNRDAKVLHIQKTTEYARGAYMYGYLVQVLKNSEKESINDTDQITAILHSTETNETGRADCFYQKKKFVVAKKQGANR